MRFFVLWVGVAITNWDAFVIGRRKDLDKSRKQVRLDLDVGPVVEGCVGASGCAAGGME